MSAPAQVVVCMLEGRRYALWLAAVERVIRMPWVTPLPDAPDVVLGVVKICGALRAVVDLRGRLRLPRRPVAPADRLLLARTERRHLAIPVDEVLGVETLDARDWIDPARFLPEPLQGAVPLLSGVIQRGELTLIHNLEKCLSSVEEATIDQALASMEAR